MSPRLVDTLARMPPQQVVDFPFKECLLNLLVTGYARRKLGYRGRPPTLQHCRA